MSKTQKRQFTRIHLSRKVTLQFHVKSYGPYRTRDLSLGGMFVLGNFQVKTGDYCQVIFIQSGTPSDLTFKALAQVIRTNNEGIAIEFTSMAFDNYMFLQTTLLYEAEDPLSISLEFPKDYHCELTEIAPAIPEPNDLFQ